MSTERTARHRWLPWVPLIGLLAVVVAGLATGVLFLVRGTTTGTAAPPVPAVPAVPAAAPAPVRTGVDITGWADQVARATGIPAQAVLAYGHAQLDLAASRPACHLSWNTLAGIAAVESDNGQFGGARITNRGAETVPIIGVPLNGAPGTRTVPDTDHGRLDGDPVYDHAVGPFQFLPSTWSRFAPPGSDPENIDAAALAAGRYLCAAGGDLRRGADWQAAVLAYNDSDAYASLVLRFADEYGRVVLG